MDSKGKVKGKKYGRVTITAKAKDGSGVKATCKLTVGYGITYKLNKGKNNSKNPAAYYNEKVKLQNPSRKGYAFKGWYTVVFQIKRAANLQIILAPYKIDVVLQPHYPETLLHITRTKILPCKLIAQEYSVSSYENGSSSSSIWQA